MKFFLLIVCVWLSPRFSDAFPDPQNRGTQRIKRDAPLKPGEREIFDFVRNYIDVDRVDEGGNSALHVAALNGFHMLATWLIKNNAIVNRANLIGNTPLHFAVISRSLKIVSLLTQNGANSNLANQFGDTALHYAASKGFDGILDVLLRNGVNIDAVNKFGDTALHFAAYNGNLKFVTKLLNKRADVNKVNQNGNSALHMAVYYDHSNIVRILLENSADDSRKNQKGETAKDIATKKGRQNILDILTRTPSFIAATSVRPVKLSTAEKACLAYSGFLEDRILGGESTVRNEFPWMVALGYQDEKNKMTYECGGVIISEFFILTAAHCATPKRTPIVVRVGKIDLLELDPEADRPIQSIVRHPEYSPVMKINDIALIRLTSPIESSSSAKPACLQTNLRDEDPSVPVIITGWGVVSYDSRDRSNVLLKASINTMPLEQCNQTVLEFNKIPNTPALRNGISDSQYCAYDPEGKKDSCQGDSGGPLQIFPRNSQVAKVIGVVSFGISCGSTYPGIYTRVAYFATWIESVVWPNGF